MIRQIGLLDLCGHELPYGIGLQAHCDDAKNRRESTVVGEEVEPGCRDFRAEKLHRHAKRFYEFGFNKPVLPKIGSVFRQLFLGADESDEIPRRDSFWIGVGKPLQHPFLQGSIDFHHSPDAVWSLVQHTGNRVTCAVVRVAGYRPNIKKPRRLQAEPGLWWRSEMTVPKHETKHQRAERLAKAAARRMANRPCERTRRTLFKHIKEGLK